MAKTNEDKLLKAIGNFLDGALEKTENEEANLEQGEEIVKKAIDDKPGKEKQDDKKDKKDDDDDDDDLGKKCKKGEVEGGEDKIKPGKPAVDKIGKKSFSGSDEEYNEYLELKKAKDEEEMKKANEEKENFQKSITDLKDVVVDLKSKVELMSKQPNAKKSVDGVDYIKKSENNDEGKDVDESTPTSGMPKHIMKARVANVMFEKGVKEKKLTAADVAEYEHSGTLLDPAKRGLVKSLVSEEIKKGGFQG